MPTPLVALPQHRGTSTTTRWFGVGASTRAEPTVAAAEAVSTALVGPDPRLVLIFASPSYALNDLIASIQALTEGAPMIGCTTAGEISTDRATQGGVVVSVLGGSGFTVTTTRAERASTDLFAAGARAAKAAHHQPAGDHNVVLMLSDGLAGNQQDVVRGAYSEVGARTPLVGGSAGDDGRMQKTAQFHDGAVLDDCIVAAAIASDAPMGIGVRHGWQPVGDPMLISRSDDTVVHEIDDAPALDVYLDRLGAPPEVRNDPDLFMTFAMRHPLGLRRRRTEEVRFVSGADFTDRSLSCIAEVPQGSLAWMMEGDRESVLLGTEQSCLEALGPIGERPPLGMLLFDCIARRGVLGDRGIESEMSVLSRLAPDVPVAGFYTYGEIARTNGVRGFHNQTLVTLAFA